MRNVHFEKGTNGASDAAFQIVANSFVGDKYGVDNVQISGFFDGILVSNNARRVAFVDGFIKAPDALTYKALFNNGKDSAITVPSNKSFVRVETFTAKVITTNTGVGTLYGDFSQFVKSNGRHVITMSYGVSGGLISGGNMSWTVTLPPQVRAVSAQISAANFVSGRSVVANVAVLSETQVRVFITPIDDNIFGDLEIEVLI
jgi:hypothetical protein